MPPNPNKVIISDTACLIGLTNIGQINILHKIHGSIIVTPEVMNEYGASLPEWIFIQEVYDFQKINIFNKLIGLGESSTIALAMETENSILIVDDRRARQFALDLGLEIIGTLGVLIKAYEKGIIHDLDTIIASLREIGFRFPANTEAIIKSAR
jgi:predicted nucleic acid-binding protein